MAEEYWVNTQLSVARYYGSVTLNGSEYTIVNKEGKDIFECSEEAEREGRDKAIEPGEPADLCRKDFIPFYRKLGRNVFIEALMKNPQLSERELKKLLRDLVKATKKA